MTCGKVSVITPSYNAEEYLSQAIESVLSQTFKNWEMIIVDDCSEDSSFQIASEYANKYEKIKSIQLTDNQGPAIARNYGIEMAKGHYIAFLDADDLWLPKKLDTQLNFMKKHDLKLTYSSYSIIDKNGKIIGEYVAPKRLNYSKLLKSNFIGNLTGIYSVNYFGKRFIPVCSHEDYVFWLNLMKEIPYTIGINTKLAKYRKAGTSFSSNKFAAIFRQWDTYRNEEDLDFFKSLYLMCTYSYYGLTKYKSC